MISTENNFVPIIVDPYQQTWRQALLPNNAPGFRLRQALVVAPIGYGIGSYYGKPKTGGLLGAYLGWAWSWGV